MLEKAIARPEAVRVAMINEVVPADPADDFFAGGEYFRCALALFAQAGLKAQSADELMLRGVYLTNAVKRPKAQSAVPLAEIQASLPALEAELDGFANLRAVMLMGDVARKAFNLIAKKRGGKNALPAASTYRLRGGEHYALGLRVYPSYIMTGPNLLIEPGKVALIVEDIRRMLGDLDIERSNL